MTHRQKVKLVFVTSRFPFPTLGGYEIKNLQLLRFLAFHFDVSAHIIQYKPIVPDDVAKLKALGVAVHVYKPSLASAVSGVIGALVSGLPLQCGLYRFAPAWRAVRSELRPGSVAFCSVIRTAPYILDTPVPAFFDLADSLGQIYRHNAETALGWRRLAYRIEAPRLLRLEQRIANESQGMFLFNPVEAAYFNLSPRVHVVPHGVEDKLFSVNSVDAVFSDGVTIIGKMDVAHNVDMVRWFAHKVMPLLPDQLKLYLIGANPSREIVELSRSDSRIIVMGFVEDPYPALRASIACICPMQTGGGIQNKLIEAMAVGAFVISSPRATMPLKDLSSSGVVVCDQPIEWAEKIIEAQTAPDRYSMHRSLGREYAREHFSWDSYKKTILNVIDNATGLLNERGSYDNARKP